MNREEFLAGMLDVLQREEDLTFDMELENIEEWDSLSKMATVAFIDSNFGVSMTFADFQELKTVEDIAKKAGL